MFLRTLFDGSIPSATKLAIVLPYIASVLIIIFLILPIHELAHGWVAHKLGDDTAKRAGRLTLNPLPSIDPFGALFLLLFGFGWAKPVMVDSRNFKNERVGMALTALAGPVSNFLCGVIGALIWWGVICATGNHAPQWVMTLLSTYVSMNVAIAVFNLVPIPPLDGSKVLGAFLSDRARANYYKYQMLIMGVVFVLLFTRVLQGPFQYVIDVCTSAVSWLGRLPFDLFGVVPYLYQ